VVPLGSIINDGAALVGFMAGAIAVGGFLAHTRPALQGREEQEIRVATVIGGLVGLGLASTSLLLATIL
jgi:hypothetical protein